MATDFMTLKATLGLDSSEYEQGLTNSEAKAKGFGSKAKTAFKAVGVGAAAIVTATAAVSGAFVKATGKVAEYGDNVDKMSQKMGLSAEKYQEWDAIMQHSGTSIDTMKASMKTLANAAEKGNEAFERIGLTQEQVANMSQQDLFEATISGLQNVEDTTERTYLAGQLLGRGATELGALLNTSAEDTEKMRQRVHELGGVMSDDAVKAAARYTDSLQDMQTALDGAKRNIVSGFLPSITTVMDGLANIFSGEKDLGLSQIQEGVSEFIQKLNSAVPEALSVGASIIGAIGQAFMENMPAIFENATSLVTNLANSLGKAAPTLIPKGIEIVGNVLKGLVSAIPSLVVGGINLITGIVNGLSNGSGTLFTKFGEILKALGQAIVDALPELGAAMLGLLEALGNYILETNWLAIAYKALMGIAGAVKAVAPIVWEAAKALVDRVINALGFKGLVAKVRSVFDGVRSAIQNKANAARARVSSVVSAIKSVMSFSGLAGKVADVFESVKTKVQDKIQSIKDKVQGMIDNIKSKFPFSIGKVFSGFIRKPSLSISKKADGGATSSMSTSDESFAKAMSQPYMFTQRTLFNQYAGEAGHEILYGRHALMNDIAEATRGAGGAINIYLNYEAGDNANDMLKDIARGIQRYKMAGVI